MNYLQLNFQKVVDFYFKMWYNIYSKKRTDRKELFIMSKKIYFDLDGTIYDLYGIENGIEKIQTEK